MLRASYHPKAFLLHTKNVKPGLNARTKIASLLEKRSSTAKVLSEGTRLSYCSVLHHLHLMEDEHIVTREERKPYIWALTGAGQRTLSEINVG